MDDLGRKETSLTRWVAILLVCLVASAVCVAYPIYVIRPFRAQGARELAAALAISRIRPWVTLASALVAIALAVGFWRAVFSRWRRIAMCAGALLVCVLAGLARVNIYELMFHPVDRPAFIRIADAKLEKDDKLIVVKVNGAARGYPIRTMGYHHVVNDVVGGTALVATY